MEKFTISGSILSVSENNSEKLLTKSLNDYINILEFNKKVQSYYTRLFKVEYYLSNELKEIIPDFFVEYKNSSFELVFINSNDQEPYSESEINIIKEFSLNNNIDLKFETEKDISESIKLFNSNYLLDFKKPKYGFNLSDTDIIYNVLNDYNVLTIEGVLNVAVQSESKKAQLLYVIWVMIANYWIEFDESVKISTKSKVWNTRYNFETNE